MREPVGTFEAHRGVGECSKVGVRGWRDIVGEYRSKDWPPDDWSVSAEVAREEHVDPTSENSVNAKFADRQEQVRRRNLSSNPVNKG